LRSPTSRTRAQLRPGPPTRLRRAFAQAPQRHDPGSCGTTRRACRAQSGIWTASPARSPSSAVGRARRDRVGDQAGSPRRRGASPRRTSRRPRERSASVLLPSRSSNARAIPCRGSRCRYPTDPATSPPRGTSVFVVLGHLRWLRLAGWRGVSSRSLSDPMRRRREPSIGLPQRGGRGRLALSRSAASVTPDRTFLLLGAASGGRLGRVRARVRSDRAGHSSPKERPVAQLRRRRRRHRR
jgi:hypothetical protein